MTAPAEQPAMTNQEMVYRIMQVIAGPPSADEDVMQAAGDELFLWRESNGDVRVMVNCSDTFAYACADAEPITPENLPVFEQAVRDCVAIDEYAYFGLLFACRIRRQLPLIPRERMNPKLRELIEAVSGV